MHIICMKPLAEGVYNDHKADHITLPPEGWAYIPEDFPLPSTFPRLGSLEAEERKCGTGETTVLTVTRMTEGTLPESGSEAEPAKTMEERVAVLEASSAELTEAMDLLLSGVTE